MISSDSMPQALSVKKKGSISTIKAKEKQLSFRKCSTAPKGFKLNKFFHSDEGAKSRKTSIFQARISNNSTKMQRLNQFVKRSFSAPLNLLNQIRILIKAAKVFRFHTKFRSLKYITDRQLGMINDLSYFPEKKQKEFFLKRFTEKNVFKRLYYTFMSCLFSNGLIILLLEKFEKIMKFFDEQLPTIKPFQKIKVLWDVLILFTIVGFFFIIPLQLSFDFSYEVELDDIMEKFALNEHLMGFLRFIPELLLIIDTLLKFMTGYYENGLVITDKRHIIKHYLKSGFMFDLLSYCPILIQSMLHDQGIGLKILQLLVFCKMKRIQIIMNNFKEMISLNGKNDYILSLIILIVTIVFFCHINACIWHLVAYYNTSNTWLDYSHTRTLLWTTRYYYALFWSISVVVTIGFGEKVSPQNNIELIVGSAIFLISALFFGYTINAMREIFDEMSKHEKQYKESLSVINQYMNNKNINFELQGRVRKYLEYIMHKETNSERENEILNKLTHALKRELILESNGKYLYQTPLFSQNFTANTLEQLAFCLKQVRYSPEEFIFHKDDIDECSMFIVTKGELEHIYENENNIKSIKSLKYGDIFGTRSFFTDDPRENSIRSKNFSTLLEIKKSDFLSVIRKNKEDFEKYSFLKDEIKLYNNYKPTQIKCLSCDKQYHLYGDCPLIHFKPNPDFIVKRYLHTPKQERNTNFLRKKKKEFNALFHNVLIQNEILFLPSSVFSADDGASECEEIQTPTKIASVLTIKKKIKPDDVSSNELKFPKIDSQSLLEEYKTPEIQNFPSKTKTNEHIAFPINHLPSEIEENIETTPFHNNNKSKLEEIVNANNNFGLNLPEKEKTNSNISLTRMPSNIKMRLLKKRTTVLERDKEKNENKSENNLYPLIKQVELYNYDFEKGRNFDFYFVNGNMKKIIQLINLKENISPVSMGSKRSHKKKVERRIRHSKFIMDSNKSKGSDVFKVDDAKISSNHT